MNADFHIPLGLLDHPLSERIGWTLLHSLWQLVVVALIAWICLRLQTRRSASARYLTASAAMLVMFALMAATFCTVRPSEVMPGAKASHAPVAVVADEPRTPQALTPNVALPQAETPSDAIAPTLDVRPAAEPSADNPWRAEFRRALAPWLPTIVGGWLIGVALLSLRPLIGWHAVRRLRRTGIDDVPASVLVLVQQTAQRLGISRAIRVVRSALVETPSVVGALRPLILLPAGALTGLSTAQLEALLAHELAHIRRHDYLVNLLQTLMETLLFYHPAVWWVSRRMRIEREHCCDDVALELCADRRVYAGALFVLEGLRSPGPATVLSAGGGSLLARIRRIASSSRPASSASPLWTMSFVAAVAALTIGFGTRPFTVDDAAGETPAAESIAWGEVSNGLRCRVVPVSPAMSEDEVSLDMPLTQFSGDDQPAFAVELENVGDAPVKILETRHGDGYGDSKGKANSDWYGQFLFALELYDGEGNRIDRPNVDVIDLNMVLSGALATTIEPGKTHRFLLRPAKWLGPLTTRFEPGKHRAAIRYRGLPARVATRIREYRPDSPVLDAWSGDVVSPSTEFEIAASSDVESPALVWGKANNGLQAAMEFRPRRSQFTHGEKPDVKLHIRNVSERPITFSSHLWQSELGVTIRDSQNAPQELQTIWYSGWTLSGRYTLQPRQTIVFDAGNLGLAATQAEADAFEDITQRKLIAPPGEYTAQALVQLGTGGELRDGKGNVLAPLDGDWKGELSTGEFPLTLAPAKAEGDASAAEAVPPLERPVSLSAKQIPLREALVRICEQAGAPLDLDEAALVEAKVPLDSLVEVEIENEPLQSALGILIDWQTYTTVYREFRRGKILLSTLSARSVRIREHLPDWLAEHYERGLVASLGDDNNVSELYLGDLASDAFLERVASLPKLRRLNLGWSKEPLTARGIAHLSKLTALETLEIHGLNGDDLGDAAIDAVKNLPALRELSISECGTTDAGVQALSSMLQLNRLSLYQEGKLTDAAIGTLAKLTSLRHLSLTSYVSTQKYGWMRFSPDALRQIADLKKLETLHLEGQTYPAGGFDFPHLRGLSLSGPFIDDAFAAQIARSRELETLTLSNTSLTDAGLEHLATLPELRHLRLNGGKITADGPRHLAEARRLDHLELRNLPLSDKSLRLIAAIKTLSRLDLYGNGELTSTALAELKAAPRLRTLYLSNFPQGLSSLAELKQVREISLMMCQITQFEYDALRQVLPNTRISVMTGGGSWISSRNGLLIPGSSDPPGDAAVPREEEQPQPPPNDDQKRPEREPIRSIEGQVLGGDGPLVGTTIIATLILEETDPATTIPARIQTPVRTLTLKSDAEGKYRIDIPAEYAGNPKLKISVAYEHAGYHSRTIGDVFVEDFQMQSINNDEPYWLSRRLSRQAIARTVLKRGTPLAGRILLPDGKPAIGATVFTRTKYRPYSWKFHDANDYTAQATTVTGEDGRFELLMDEPAILIVNLAGQAPLVIDDLQKYIPVANGDPPGTFRFPRAIRSRGRVLTHDGRPVPGAIVSARRAFQYNEFDMPTAFGVSCAANVNGEFELPPLPAGEFEFQINARVEDPSKIETYNEIARATPPPLFVILPSPRRGWSPPATVPLEEVFLGKTYTLGDIATAPEVEFRAVETVNVDLRVEFPGGTRRDDGSEIDVTVFGQMEGRRWSGISGRADDDGRIRLVVPKGVQDLRIGTGLAFHRRTPDGPRELGYAVPLGTVDEDISGIVVIKPPLAKLRVQLTLPEELARANQHVSIHAYYAREGYSEHQPGPAQQGINLSGAIQSGNTEYRGQSLPDEEIILRVTTGQTVLHEERLTLKSGEDRQHAIDLTLPRK